MKKCMENITYNSDYLNSLAAISVIFVVLGNFIGLCIGNSDITKGILLFNYAIQSPLLIYFSGLQCKRILNDEHKVFRTAFYVFCLYVLQKVVICIVRAIFNGKISFSLFTESGVPWYFLAMSIYLLISYFLRNLNLKIVLLASGVIALLAGYRPEIGDYLALSRIIVFYPFFLIGWSTEIERVAVKLSGKKIYKIVGLLTLTVLFIIMIVFINPAYILRPIFTGRNSYTVLKEYFTFGVAFRLFAYFVSVISIFSILILVPEKGLGWLNKIGRAFLPIYFWNRPIIYILTNLGILNWLILYFGGKLGRIIWTICGFVCVFALSYTNLKRLFKYLYQIIENFSFDSFCEFFSIKSKKEYFVIYTAIFLVLVLLIYSPYFSSGKTFIWRNDGRLQHYPFMIFYSQTLRQIVENIISGHFSIPLFTLNVGLGDDIIGLLGSNGALDPLYLLTFWAPFKYSEYAYDFLAIFRVYLAGVSFSCLCFYLKKEKLNTLIGSVVYCFSGYVFLCSMRHPYYINPMIFLPIIIMGVEKILRREKSYIFIIAIGYAALCGFYHLYMVSIILIVYGFIRFWDFYKTERFKKFIKVVGHGLLFYILGIGITATIFFPMVMEFLMGNRSGFSNYNGPYNSDYYRLRLLRLIAPPGSWDDMSFAAIALIALIFLFMSKERRSLKVLNIVALSFWLTSIGGLIMNGFQYSSNRWTFALVLIIAFDIVEMLPELLVFSRKEKLLCVFMMVTYIVIVFGGDTLRRTNYILVGLVFLTLSVWVLAIDLNEKYGVLHFQNQKAVFLLFLVVFNVAVNGIYKYAEGLGNYSSEFEKNGYELEQLIIAPEHEVKEYVPDYMGGRADSTKFTLNKSLVWSVPSMLAYSATINGNIVKFWNSVENCGSNQAFDINSTDQRSIIGTLLSEKYHIEPRKKEPYVPYGYYEYKTTDSGNLIYQNRYALPWGYTYDTQIAYDELDKLNGLQKQEAMLQSIALYDEGSTCGASEITFDEREIPYNITYHDCQWENGKLSVLKANATIELTFSMPEQVEGYVRLSGFDINESGVTSFRLKVNCDDIEKTAFVSSNLFTWYYGRENYLINLGYNEGKRTSCIITFPLKGEFRLNNIKLYALPMNNINSRNL